MGFDRTVFVTLAQIFVGKCSIQEVETWNSLAPTREDEVQSLTKQLRTTHEALASCEQKLEGERGKAKEAHSAVSAQMVEAKRQSVLTLDSFKADHSVELARAQKECVLTLESAAQEKVEEIESLQQNHHAETESLKRIHEAGMKKVLADSQLALEKVKIVIKLLRVAPLLSLDLLKHPSTLTTQVALETNDKGSSSSSSSRSIMIVAEVAKKREEILDR